MRLIPLMVALAACTEPEPGDPDGPDTDTRPDPSDTGGSGPTSGSQLDEVGKAGSVVIAQVRADARRAVTTLSSVGLFVDDTQGVLNLAGCAELGGPCITALPEDGDTLDVFPSPAPILQQAEWFDAGDWVVAGGHTLYKRDDKTSIAYFGDPGRLGGDGSLELDGDLAPFEGVGLFDHTASMDLVSPPPDERVAVVPGQTLELSWNDSGPGEVFLFLGDRLVNPAGNTYALDIDELGLRPPLDRGVILLRRQTLTRVDAGGNDVWVNTLSDQNLYLDFEDPRGWTELTLGVELAEDCDDALVAPTLGPGRYHGDTDDLHDDIDLPYYNAATGFPTPGPEGVVAVHLEAGQTLHATYRQVDDDASLYVLDANCDPEDATVGSDNTFFGEDEQITFEAEVAQTVLLVLDSFNDDGGPFSLVLEIDGVVTLPTDTGTTGFTLRPTDTAVGDTADTGR